MGKEQSKINWSEIKISGGNCLKYLLNNAREIELCTDAQVQEAFENNKITSINTGNFTISINDSFKHERTDIPSSYLIKEIEKFEGKLFKNSYTLTTHKRNLTSQYILPYLGLTRKDLHYNGFLINGYLTDKIEEIALLYRFSTNEGYGILEANLNKCKYFNRIDNSIEGFDLVYMNVPKEFHKDLTIFSQGGYSRISDNLKKKIVEFHGLTKKDYLYKVIFKEPDLRKKFEKDWDCNFEFIELAQKPDLKEEILQL